MKKGMLVLLALLAAVSCTACSDEKGALQTSQKYLESVRDSKESAANSSLYDITDWLTPEIEYKQSDDISSKNDKLYMQYNYNGESRLGYISAKTGELFDICPDPLCDHSASNGCKYTDMSSVLISPVDDTKLYTTRFVYENNKRSVVILLMNIETGEISEQYRCTFDENTYYTLVLKEITADHLYFRKRNYTKVEDADETKTISEDQLLKMNLTTGEIEVLVRGNDFPSIQTMTDDNLFFIDKSGTQLFMTDLEYENKVVIADLNQMFDNGSEYGFYDLYFDSIDNVMYFSIISTYVTGVSSQSMHIEDGGIYCYDFETSDVSQIEMLHSNINGFYLTDTHIYYTIYDPVSFGKSRVGLCTDETGNKIYRVSLDNTMSEPELIFDGHNEFLFSGYRVMGDYLYLDYMKLIQGADMSYFQSTGMTARVNFKENTIKWLDLN